MKSPTKTLLSEVAQFLRDTGMAPSAFGHLALGDRNLVSDLRAGRELRHRNFLRVKKFMSSYEREAA
jgi:hypothetical protein